MRVAIIGAGAAGCFCAVNLKRQLPTAEVSIYESGTRPLAKVAITGGGRCNLTNTFAQIKSLGQAYPRGERLMKRLMHQFSEKDTLKWWEAEGVRLVTQPDECIFPASQDAMQIVGTFTRLLVQLRVPIHLGHRVQSITHDNEYTLTFDNSQTEPVKADIVVVCTGGSPKLSGLNMLSALELATESPVPSLFTFCIGAPGLSDLMGTVVTNTSTAITGTKFKASGPLLITHWGMSGPAILKLSSYAARHLAEHDYKAELCVNWYGERSQDEVATELNKIAADNTGKLVINCYPPHLTHRHWQFLTERAGIGKEMRWKDMTRKHHNRLLNQLVADIYAIEGKGQYKEEFVTCGGISLSNLDQNTLECKKHPGLYLAGEVTDVDAITGGFNLQAAWTMGYVVAQSIAKRGKE